MAAVPRKLQRNELRTNVFTKVNEIIDYLESTKITGDNVTIRVSRQAAGVMLSAIQSPGSIPVCAPPDPAPVSMFCVTDITKYSETVKTMQRIRIGAGTVSGYGFSALNFAERELDVSGAPDVSSIRLYFFDYTLAGTDPFAVKAEAFNSNYPAFHAVELAQINRTGKTVVQKLVMHGGILSLGSGYSGDFMCAPAGAGKICCKGGNTENLNLPLTVLTVEGATKLYLKLSRVNDAYSLSLELLTRNVSGDEPYTLLAEYSANQGVVQSWTGGGGNIFSSRFFL